MSFYIRQLSKYRQMSKLKTPIIQNCKEKPLHRTIYIVEKISGQNNFVLQLFYYCEQLFIYYL